VHRLFGVAEIRVETGGGDKPEATISVLHETAFEEMRRRIFEGRARAVPAAVDHTEAAEAPAAEADSSTLLHLPLRELLLNGVLDNRGVFIIATAYGVLWEAGLLGAFWDRLTGFAYGSGMIRETVSTIAAGRVPSLLPIAILLVGLVGVLLAVRVLSMIWSVLRLYDFRLTRTGDDLRTEYGLLTRVTATIPLRRVQSLIVGETLLQRLLSRMSVRVETAGGQAKPHNGEMKQPRESLAPLIHRDAVPALVRQVLPGFDLHALDWQPLHPRAFRRALRPALVLLTIATVVTVAWFGWKVLLLLPFALAWVAFTTAKHVAHTHWASTDAVVAFRSGWLWRRLTVVPVAKIQAVGRFESPFDRRALMASIRVDTAGGASPMHRISIPYLARETAAGLYERLAAQTAQTAFRW
jgi:putative membrane protein